VSVRVLDIKSTCLPVRPAGCQPAKKIARDIEVDGKKRQGERCPYIDSQSNGKEDGSGGQ
jgi:hypothetical protein